MPLGARASGAEDRWFEASPAMEERGEEENPENSGARTATGTKARAAQRRAFQVKSAAAGTQTGARSPEYARVLERYLARLVELQQIPAALAVLRREIEHNPDDPGLYARLAVFLDQNRLGTELEETYRRAMARFPDRTWYHKLARYYLRERREAEYEKLTQEAVKAFKGTELEAYFQNVVDGSPALYLRVNQYANARFPHNPVFVENLLSAYRNHETWNPQAWEALLRQHWFEEEVLRNQFFQFLSSSGKLESELRTLEQTTPANGRGSWDEFVRANPVGGRFLVEAQLWRSHFEESAPVLEALAQEYPTEGELDRQASSVFRSLAYFDAAKTDVAVKIESNLLAANPGSAETLTRIGDIYSDRNLFAQAAPYWERIPKVAPGESDGYLQAATIYWDYFDFDNALRLLEEGRKKLGQDTLYGYEAGAIFENKRDYPQAIHEYAKAALDAGSESPAANRLLQLARRPKFRELADRESEKLATASNLAMPAVHLRVAVLEAQDRKPELSAFLETVLKNVTTIEQAAEIEGLAQQKSLESVREHALEKQVVLATDPVTKLQLRYALVHLYESRKDLASAQRNIETLYRENSKILGVVRSTVDFDQYTLLHYFAKAIELPIRTAPGCQLGPKEAATLGALAPKLHAYLDFIAPKDETGKRRNPERVREALRQERRGKRPEWLRAEAVPAMVQILMAEDLAIRLILVDMLSEIEGKQATVALAQRAVFDLSPEVRLTALTALRERPREHSRPILVSALRYPWAPAADHAAEALVYLDDKEAALLLVAQLGKPDPAVPFAIKNGAAVREVVKINHQANCLLCHAPAVGGRSDPVVGIDPLVTVTGGGGRYEGPRRTWSLFIRADVQFLHQDFSITFPIGKPYLEVQGLRFDYIVRTRPLKGAELRDWKKQPPPDQTLYAQRDATLFALRALTGNDVGPTTAAWVQLYPHADAEAEGVRLSTALVRAAPEQRAELLARYRDSKEEHYTEGLAHALPHLAGRAWQDKVRLALVERLAHLPAGLLRVRLQDEDDELRRAAALACIGKAERELTPELIGLLLDTEPVVARGAQKVLQMLSDEDFGPGPDAGMDERIAAALRWQNWWREQSAE